jgi:hypothetical protein
MIALALIPACSGVIVRAADYTVLRIPPRASITTRAQILTARSTQPETVCQGNCPAIATIDYPGASQTQLQTINDRGIIAGAALDNTQTIISFLRDPIDGTFVLVQGPGALFFTFILAMNNGGDVTGEFAATPGQNNPFLRTRDGDLIQFDVPGSGTGNGQGGFGANINMKGTITGTYIDAANVNHVFFRFRDGTIQTFDVPGAGTGPFQGTLVTVDDGLNSEGDIVGGYIDSSNVLHGFIRLHDGEVLYFDPPAQGLWLTMELMTGWKLLERTLTRAT